MARVAYMEQSEMDDREALLQPEQDIMKKANGASLRNGEYRQLPSALYSVNINEKTESASTALSKINPSEGSENEFMTLAEAIKAVGFGWQQIRVIIICGLCFCTDSIEVGLLTFLQVEAKESFHLSDIQESTLTSVVFAGELIGALFWGPFADKFGRKRGSFFPAMMVAVSGVAR
eukprot:gene11135-3195_t